MGSATEPYGDAFDCLSEALQSAVNVAFANITKAIGDYEWELRSSATHPSIASWPVTTAAIPPPAVRGLRLFVGRPPAWTATARPMLSDGRFHNIGCPSAAPACPPRPIAPRAGASATA
jgi:hypothetical protein